MSQDNCNNEISIQKFIKITSKLNADLTLYGLDPNEWMLKQYNDNLFMLVNLKDPNFKIMGVIEKKNEP
jgi:hypothetical protein